jgi:hypothetical protein
MRLALIHTTDFGFSGWEIHTTECDHVTKSIHRGSFVAIVSAQSPGAFVEAEIAARAEESLGDEDFKVMPCWADTDKYMDAAASLITTSSATVRSGSFPQGTPRPYATG